VIEEGDIEDEIVFNDKKISELGIKDDDCSVAIQDIKEP